MRTVSNVMLMYKCTHCREIDRSQHFGQHVDEKEAPSAMLGVILIVVILIVTVMWTCRSVQVIVLLVLRVVVILNTALLVVADQLLFGHRLQAVNASATD